MSRDICVIVPTIREYECMRSYFENAREHGFDLSRLDVILVTEDFCDTDEMEAMLAAEDDVAGEVFDGTRREEWYEANDIEEYSHIVPAASHAETSFGLLYMWAGDYDYGFFIDDDTLPHDEWDFFGAHMDNLAFEGEIETVSSDEQWVNVLYQNADEHDLYPRGYPYSAMHERVETEQAHADNIVASQGLWTNVPDLDAVRILMDGDLQGQAQTRTTKDDYDGDFVAAEGNYLTVCSMNLAFRREVIPAFYQLPMDENEWDVGRFDDIWSGVFLKRACDILGTQIYNGDPLCEHNKAARSTFDDLNNEVPGLELNEHLWEIVDSVEPEIPRAARTAQPSEDDVGEKAAEAVDQSGDSFGADPEAYAAVFEAMANELEGGDWEAYNNGEFFNYVGEFMGDWLDCLDALAETAPTANQ